MMIYYPINYNPYKNETIELSEKVKRKAVLAGGTHIAKDGKSCYAKRFGLVYRCDFDGTSYGSWWSTGQEEFPEGLINLEAV